MKSRLTIIFLMSLFLLWNCLPVLAQTPLQPLPTPKTLPSPDLIIKALTHENAMQPLLRIVNVQVCNIGKIDVTRPCYLQFKLEKMGMPRGGGEVLVPPIATSACQWLKISYTLLQPGDTYSEYYTVDSKNQIAESNESNNTFKYPNAIF